MSRPIITCDRLSKKYNLGLRRGDGFQSGPPSLRESISERLRAARDAIAGRRDQNGKSKGDQEFWALKDVSFEVGRGEVVGIVGRNGAGKSTLLKILSRIVEPTAGTARLRGRLASLLEVGTGFNPELTGRENTYLNGAILGMRKAEIDRKFDQIVAFAEIEDFLDTPVKHYSSGMYVRLAFAVAAHLEPEILIVDEVLAVGDFAFQKKCLGKMHDVVSDDGRTILFVSHHMGALTQLCQRGVLLEKGAVAKIGPIDEVVQHYLRSDRDRDKASAHFPIDPSKVCQFLSCEVLHSDGTQGADFSCDEPVIIRLRLEVRRSAPGTFLTLTVQNIEGIIILFSDIRDVEPSLTERLAVGRHTLEITIPPRLLAQTTYQLTINLVDRTPGVFFDQRAFCSEFTLRDLADHRADRWGVLSARLPWVHREAGPLEPDAAP
jgi:lipopolysaccharide transport system ATP-binding protein